MATYIERLKQSNPDAYARLENLMSYTANENFGGKPQDYQAQIFTNLDTSKFDAPKKIEANPDIQGGVPKGVTPQYTYESNGEFTNQILNGYTKDVGTVNGIPVVANYDAQGNLTGYSGDQRMRNFVSGNQSYAGRWDAEGNAKPQVYTSSGGGFLGGLVGDVGGAIGNIAGAFGDLAQSDLGKAALLATGAYYGLPALAGESTALTGVDAALADLAAGAPAFTPEAAAIATPALTGVDAALADLAASAPAIAPEFIAAPVATELTGVDAALADLAASAPAITPEVIAAPVATELTGVDAALADLAASTPAFTGAELAIPAASGITLSNVLDTARAGLLVNALTGDPLGLSDTGGSGTSAPTGFAQVPIPEDWKSPTYTYSPVQNVTFEDLFPAVSLQGTQWQNMPKAQTFNEMFASGLQTPMGSPVDINQIVGSILGQSAKS